MSHLWKIKIPQTVPNKNVEVHYLLKLDPRDNCLVCEDGRENVENTEEVRRLEGDPGRNKIVELKLDQMMDKFLEMLYEDKEQYSKGFMSQGWREKTEEVHHMMMEEIEKK